MNALKDDFEILTVGIGPRPTWSTCHVDVSELHPARSTFFRTLFLITRVMLFAVAAFLGIDRIAGRFLPYDRTSPSPRVILRRIKHLNVDLICGRDLHSVWIARSVPCRAAVWIDLPDFTPLQQDNRTWWRLTWGRYFCRVASSLRESGFLLTTVSRGLASRFRSDFGLETHLLLNVPVRSFVSGSKKHLPELPLRLVHSGAAIRARGLEVMIDAVKELDDVTLDLILLPTDRQYLDSLTEMCSATFNCHVRAPVERTEIIRDLVNYDCALIVIQPSNFNYASCLPNKFFEAIQAGLPLIVGPTPDMAQIVESHRIGWVSDSFDSFDLRSQIVLAREDKRRGGLADFSLSLTQSADEFCADFEDTRLRHLIQGLLVPNPRA